MPFTAIRALALRKGFDMRLTPHWGCQLVDRLTHLPELNQIAGTAYFASEEALAFLDTLPDRMMRES